MATAFLRPATYDSQRMVVVTDVLINGKPVFCSVSREALEDHFGVQSGARPDEFVAAYIPNRDEIDAVLIAHYRAHPNQQPMALTGDF